MKSLKTSAIRSKPSTTFARKRKNSAGFTLIEILVLTAIITTFAGMGLFFTLDAYRGSLFRSEVSIIVNLLQKARNQAMNNVGQTPHGVKFESDEYILFHRDSYLPIPSDPTDEVILANPSVVSVTGLSGVVFDQLTGSVGTAMTGVITITYGHREVEIDINNEGRIDW